MLKQKLVILLGTKFDAIELVRGRGFRVLLISDNPKLENTPDRVYFPFELSQKGVYNLDFFKPYINEELEAVIVCVEDFVELGAQLRARYPQIPQLGPNEIQAKTLRSKVLMKSFARSVGVPTTNFVEIDANSDFLAISTQIGLPFLLKPKLGWLAQGIHLIGSEIEWKSALAKISDVDTYFAEEYLANIKEYCCDTLVADGVFVAQFAGEYSVSCLESNHKHEGIGVSFPGFLSTEAIEQLKALTRTFIETLGVRDGFFHTEFLWTPERGWMFGEVGCRLPGGYQLPTESKIVETNLLDFYLKMFLPKFRCATYKALPFVNPFVGYYLFPKLAGTVKAVRAESSENLPWVFEFKRYVKEGDVLDHEDSSVTMAAHVLYGASSLAELESRSKSIRTFFSADYEES